jgi:hypothetical protein
LRKAAQASALIRSAVAVKPVMSVNITVTSRRSEVGTPASP